MPQLRFSRRAANDPIEIASYTLRAWGEKQVIRYIDDIEECCRGLAGRPELGRACGEVRSGLRRIERGRHVVFYRQVTGGIQVSRILHQRMLPETRAIEDEEAGR